MSETVLRQFLLVYEVASGVVDIQDLGEDPEAAAARYAEVEEELRGKRGYEIVLIGADSIETIRTTHAHYFESEGNGHLSLRSRLLASTSPD